MLNSGIIGNRISTPDSSLRPPTSARTFGAGHQFRASADMSSFNTSSPQLGRARPSSEYYGQHSLPQGLPSPEESAETQAQQWINDINQNEQTLEEMAAATLDQDFKGELSAIEQWFRVLSEAERTAALYALIQQTTPVQIRFFIQLLKQMGKNHPMAGISSPATFDKDPMQAQLSNAMNKLSTDGARAPPTRNSAPPTKRLSGLDASTINAMFPDAAAAIATEKAKFTQQTGNTPLSNRNSAVFDPIRTSLIAPTITTSIDLDANGPAPSSPWLARSIDVSRPKSASGLPAMGHFQQPPLSAGIRSPRTNIPGALNLQNSNLTNIDGKGIDMPLLSPYTSSGNWASMVNTPMTANFATGTAANGADLAQMNMKLAALSTVNSRLAMDNNRTRRARSTDPNGNIMQTPLSPGLPNSLFMVNNGGQVLNGDQLIALQALQLQQQQAQLGMLGINRSRPNSPGLAMQGGFAQQMNFASPQNNGFLTSYNVPSPLMNHGMGQIGQMSGLNPGSFGHDNFAGDDMARGRSPRGRRGSSKPPEDPTDPSLLQDIPSWLRSLRLHKYTDNLKSMKWDELVELDEAALEAKGVAAVGARRKMLKVFEQVKEAKAEGKL